MLTGAKKTADRHIECFAQKVKARSLNGRQDVDTCTKVEGLGAAFILFTALIKFSLDLKKRIAVIRDFRPYNNIAHIFKGCRDLGPSRNFPYPCIAFAVRQNYDVAGKVWGMTSAEIEQHAVVTGNRIYFHFGNHRNHYAFSSFVLCTLLQMPILK